MAKFNYGKMANTAITSIDKFGQTIKLIRVTKGNGPAYNPKPASETVYEASAVILPASKGTIEAFDNRIESGTLIDERLRYVQMATNIKKISGDGPEVITPKSNDFLEFDGERWTILGCTPLNPAGLPVIYRMGVKR